MSGSMRLLAAVIAAAAVLSAAPSCSSKKSSGKSQPAASDTDAAETTAADGNGSLSAEELEITWLADYDLNPAENSKRSAALAIFEDIYGGRINYVQTSPDGKFSTLDSMLASGETVDMFPCDPGVFPDGVMRDRFAPLDPYFGDMGVNDGLWADTEQLSDALAYKGQHYIMPYSVSDPQILTYSRKLMKSEGIDDPRKLWQEGKWDWDAMKSMIDKFKKNQPNAARYGINGSYGQAALASTGHTVVSFDGSSLKNNLADADIGKAVGLICDIRNNGWYSSILRDTFPSDFNTLFFASGSWTLGISNAANPEGDLMIVPFPKSPDADKCYISCNINSRMLVKSSDKGRAVAAYLRCERLAATEEKFVKAAREEATAEKKNASGSFRSFITDEQYDALQEYLDPTKVTPVFDCGWGMGDTMSGNGNYTTDSRGVMQRITETGPYGRSYEQLRDELSSVIDSEIAKYNS